MLILNQIPSNIFIFNVFGNLINDFILRKNEVNAILVLLNKESLDVGYMLNISPL